MGTTLKWAVNYASWHCKESDDTPFAPVSASQGPQDAPVVHLFVPGAGAVGTTLNSTKKLASGHCKESDDTPFSPVSAPQGHQDAPVVSLLVPGAG